MMRHLIVLLFLSFGITLAAQHSNFKVKGQVVDAESGQPIEYATVLLMDAGTEEMLSGTTTDQDGRFELQGSSQKVYLDVGFIGYANEKVTDLIFQEGWADLGVIAMGADSETLEEIEVTAERSTTEFKLDKRVFNVGNDLSSSGASALEVLNNVPSVNVNIEGQISLRGATGVQILINGKPSILADDSSNALGTITAEMIEKVEVITNPSAKYEAEGTSGIINIVLKKEEKKGLNGSVSVNTGVPHNHSVGLSMNRRTERFNLFTQMGIGYRELPTDLENINSDLISGEELLSRGKEFRNETFYNLILGTDFYVNPLNVITLSGSYAYEVEDQPSETDFTFRDGFQNQSVWKRNEMTEATNPKLQYELQYKSTFPDNEDHTLLFSAIGRYFGKDQSSTFTNTFSQGQKNFSDQLTATKFEEGKYTFNLDYTKPFQDRWTLETGMQYLVNDVSNDFEVKDKVGNDFVIDTTQTNTFQYDQKVLGVYGTGSYEGDVWGVKLGMRVENTDLNTLLVNNGATNDRVFTDLFPSAHMSYKLTEGLSLQAGYSRRIFRPRLWDLNPFFNIRNNFSVRVGNPDLLPEYTDSYEVGSIFIFEKTSFNFSLYHRYTTDKIDRVSTFVNNVNTFRPENIGTNKATGAEANFKYTPGKKLTFNGDLNYNFFKREGRFNDQDFDFNADQWSGKLTTKYKVSKALDMEVTTRYESEERTIQGVNSDNLFADFGLRYKMMKGRAVFNFSVRDVFASRVRENTIRQDDFFLYTRRQRGRFITLGFSYGFGKGEAMQYSGRRR